jgi:hypothetical protein
MAFFGGDMLRVIGCIHISGTKAGLETLVSNSVIPSGILKQIGTKRKIPDVDSWSYSSPWYRFHFDFEQFDEEICDFLLAHQQLKDYLDIRDTRIKYAIFTLCPVGQSHEETFACLLSQKTLKVLVDLGLCLEIAPEVLSSEAPYWEYNP